MKTRHPQIVEFFWFNDLLSCDVIKLLPLKSLRVSNKITTCGPLVHLFIWSIRCCLC